MNRKLNEMNRLLNDYNYKIHGHLHGRLDVHGQLGRPLLCRLPLPVRVKLS